MMHTAERWLPITREGKGVQFDENAYDLSQPGSGADLTCIDDFERPLARRLQ